MSEELLALKLAQPIPIQALRCNTHQGQNITQACIELHCRNKPLMCTKCISEDQVLHTSHSQKIIDFETFVLSFSSEMSKLSEQNKRLYQEFIQNRENSQILKLLEQGDAHLQKVEDLVIRQKTMIAQDITQIQERIQIVVQQIKDESLKKLDDFYQQYQQSFTTLKENIDSFFQLSRKNYFYSNTNTLQQKLLSLSGNEAQELLLNLKKHMNVSKSLNHVESNNATPLQILTDLQTLATFLQKMSQTLPTYNRLEGEKNGIMESVIREVGQVLNNVIDSRLFVPVGGQKESTLVLNGQNNLQIQIESRNCDEFILKPSKKYQLDFPVQNILTITDQVYVMTSSSDILLRIFDAVQKKMVTYPGHTEQINYLERILIEGKQKQFVSAGQDKQLIVWMFEDISKSNQIKIFRKFSMLNSPTHVLDLKDFSHIAVCDSNREMQKVGSQSQTRHLQKINGLVLYRQGEKFLSYSADSIITVWRIIKRDNQEPMIISEHTVQDPLFGTISQIFITTQWINQAIIINAEGEVKIFDLSKNCPIFSQFAGRQLKSSFMECILIEQADRKVAPTNWLIMFSFSENIAIQYRLTNEPCTIYSADVKLEHKLRNEQNNSKHKVQLYQIGSHISQQSVQVAKLGTLMAMFVNQANQELLIYEVKGK